jgi:hypothetical protein
MHKPLGEEVSVFISKRTKAGRRTLTRLTPVRGSGGPEDQSNGKEWKP